MDRLYLPTPATLWALLRSAAGRGLTGEVVLRERDGRCHRVTLRGGRVVAAHAAGRFEPLLELLRRDGSLDASSWQATLEALGRSERRAGQLAIELAGIPRDTVRVALATQTRHALTWALGRADRYGAEAWTRARPVAPSEVATSLSVDELLASSTPATVGLPDAPRAPSAPATVGLPDAPRAPSAPPAYCGRGPERAYGDTRRCRPPKARPRPQISARPDRRALRRLAFALHPDRHGHLDPEAQIALAARLARATAAFHGLD